MVGAVDALAHKGVDRLVADGVRPRLDFAAAIAIEGPLSEDFAGQAHACAHLDPVLGMAHIIEPDHGRLGRIGRLETHPAAALRPHRADMGLKAVLAGERRGVIGDGKREEVKLDVRIADAGARADEAASLEMIRGAEALAAQEPLGPDQRPPNEAGVAIKGNGLFRSDLDGEFEMVLQVLADACPISDDFDPERFRARPPARRRKA